MAESLFFSACCNTFSARTDLSPLSPTRMFDTSFSTLITRIEFSDASFSLARTIKPQPLGTQTFPTCLPLTLPFLSWVLGSHPWLFSSRVLGSRPWLFFFRHVHLARVSSNLLLTSWLVSARVASSLLVNLLLTPLTDSFSVCLAPVAGCNRVYVSCSKHSLRALGTDTNGCLRRAAPRHGPHGSTSHKPPAMASAPRFSDVASRETSGVASRRATPFRRLRHQPSRAAPPHAFPRASVRKLRWSGLFTTLVAVCQSSSTTLKVTLHGLTTTLLFFLRILARGSRRNKQPSPVPVRVTY